MSFVASSEPWGEILRKQGLTPGLFTTIKLKFSEHFFLLIYLIVQFLFLLSYEGYQKYFPQPLLLVFTDVKYWKSIVKQWSINIAFSNLNFNIVL